MRLLGRAGTFFILFSFGFGLNFAKNNTHPIFSAGQVYSTKCVPNIQQCLVAKNKIPTF
jgi:hypothetical protein